MNASGIEAQPKTIKSRPPKHKNTLIGANWTMALPESNSTSARLHDCWSAQRLVDISFISHTYIPECCKGCVVPCLMSNEAQVNPWTFLNRPTLSHNYWIPKTLSFHWMAHRTINSSRIPPMFHFSPSQ